MKLYEKPKMKLSTILPSRNNMPYVNIKITRENGVPTKEQKEQLIEGTTRLIADVLGKNPKTTFVIIEELETDNWGIAGESITNRRKREK